MTTSKKAAANNIISLARKRQPGAELNIARLVDTRLLVQGGSGSGKSTVVRRILEQSSGQLQQIILDPEGEFSTLRQVGDYLHCAKDGDVPTDLKSAALLAKRIRQTGVSAVIDIYELKPLERQQFVARFLEGLMASPKKYWRESLLFIDETHMFAPQARSSECLVAVQDAAARGRKRKLGLICATQRLSKLHKDVAAELQNRLIGQTGLKNDLRSAADDMGLTYTEARSALVNLKPGEFWSFGPALIGEYTLFQAAMTKTSAATAETPIAKASASLSKVIESLADLSKQAAKKAQDLADLKADNAKLQRENARLAKAAEAAGVPEVEVQKRISAAVAQVAPAPAANMDAQKIVRLANQIIEVADAVPARSETNRPAGETIPRKRGTIPPVAANPARSGGTIAKGELKVLIAIAQHSDGVDREQVTILTGYKTSTRNAYIQRLQQAGLIDIGPPIMATEAGHAALPADFEPLPTGEELQQYWLSRLPQGERTVFEPILAAYPGGVSREQVSIETGYKTSTRNAYIQRLQTRKLVTVRGSEVFASSKLFEGNDQ